MDAMTKQHLLALDHIRSVAAAQLEQAGWAQGATVEVEPEPETVIDPWLTDDKIRDALALWIRLNDADTLHCLRCDGMLETILAPGMEAQRNEVFSNIMIRKLSFL